MGIDALSGRARGRSKNKSAENIATFACFLDIDGILISLTGAPDRERVPAALLSDLHLLRRRLGGALALVSSRTIGDIDRRMGLDELDIAGVYGAELRIGGCIVRMTPDTPDLLDRIKSRVSALGRIHGGCIFEDKWAGFAVHWHKAPHLDLVVLDHIKEAASALGPSFKIVRRGRSIDVIPTGAVKSGAIARYLCLAPYAGRIPIFIGAAETDEAGFELVNIAGGITVRVGDHRTSATHRLMGPDAVHRLIASWAKGAPFGII